MKDALEGEIKGKFVDNQAWEVVKREDWMHVIKSKWVLKFTLNEDGSIKSVKARLVACGYSQIAGKEYSEVFAKTLAIPMLRLFFSMVCLLDLETDHIDAKKAFTQSDVDCDLYTSKCRTASPSRAMC